MLDKELAGAIEAEKRGQLCALGVCIVFAGITAYAAYLGHQALAVLLGGSSLGTIVYAFIAGRRSGNDVETEKAEKSEPED